MDLRYIEQFETVAKLKSFSNAAYELNITQSTLSKHIASLEDDLHTKLFVRTSRKIELTESGEILLKYCPLLSETIYSLLSEIKNTRSHVNEVIVLGSQSALIHCGILDVIQEFSSVHPEINILPNDFVIGVADPFSVKNLKLCLCRKIPGGDDKYEYTLYQKGFIGVVLPVDHPLASRKSLTWKDLLYEDFLYGSSDLEDIIRSHFKPFNVEPTLIHLDNMQIGSIYEYVSIGRGITLSKQSLYNFFKNEGTTIVPLVPEIPRHLYLARKRGVTLSQGELLFWNYIHDNYPKE